MAKQVGTFKIDGTIGDLTFYKSQGQHLVRQKGGVSGDRIKNDPNFARTRENNSEFGQAGTVGKGIRDAMRNMIDKASDSRVTSRLVQQLFTVIKSDTVNQRGQRTVASGNVGLLTGFEFNSRGKLSGTLFAPMAYVIDRAGASVRTSGNLNPINDLKVPSGATHYKLTNAALAIDLANLEAQELSVAATPESVIDATVTPISLDVELFSDLTSKVIMQLVLIEFLQEVNGAFYSLRNGSFNALRVVGVDVV